MRPVPLVWLVGPAVLLLVVGVVGSWPVRGWNYIDWLAVSGLPREVGSVAGLVAGVAAAGFAVRRCAPATPLAFPVAWRAGWQVVRAHLGRLVGVWVGAYALGLVPAFGLAAVRGAESGGPDWLVAAGGLVAVAVYVVVGYGLGVVAPVRLTPVFVGLLGFVAVFAWQYVPQSGRLGLPVFPVVESVLRPPNPVFAWARLGLLAVVAGVVVWTAGAVLRGRRRCAAVPPARPLVALLVVVGVLAGAGLSGVRVTREASATERVCERASGLRVCVAAIKRPALEEVGAVAARVLAPLGGPPPEFAGVHDWAVLPRGEEDIPPGAVAVSVPRDRPIASTVAVTVAQWASGESGCHERFVEDDVPDNATMDLVSAFTVWLLDQAGYPGLAADYKGTDPSGLTTAAVDSIPDRERVAAWYGRHGATLRACRLPEEPL